MHIRKGDLDIYLHARLAKTKGPTEGRPIPERHNEFAARNPRDVGFLELPVNDPPLRTGAHAVETHDLNVGFLVRVVTLVKEQREVAARVSERSGETLDVYFLY